MRRELYVLFMIVFLSSAALASVKEAKVTRPEMPTFIGYVENELVIKFDLAVSNRFNRSVLSSGRFGVTNLDKVAEKYQTLNIFQRFPRAEILNYQGKEVNLRGWFQIQFKQSVNIDEAIADFLAETGVLAAEKIGIHSVFANPNDGNYSSQYHLNQANDHDIDAPEAWNLETGNENIIVGILDTGVRYFHKDLGGSNASYSTPTNVDGNMWINWAEKNGTAGVDDDNNGYNDDWIGWDWVTGVTGWSGEDASTPDNDPRDFNGHGTHCAGNVGALNNNGYACAAASGGWGNGSLQADGNGVKVMPLRIGYSGRYLFSEAGFVRMDFAASAFYYAANNGAKITSCSWGSSNSGGLADAINYFLAHGGLIFKAAGNNNNQTTDYMTNRSDIISVAATDANDVKASFSSYGTWVDISAPGNAIYSLYHNHSDAQNDYIASLSGTSMATPIAASVAALIWSHNPSWSAEQVKQQLFNTADNIDGISGNSSYVGKLGVGRVNAFAAVNTGGGPTAPVAAFSATATSGCAPMSVNFTDMSTGEVASWSWSFGDGGVSTDENPVHIFQTTGTYTISLTVTGPGGSDDEIKNNYIVVSSSPTAAYSGTPTTGDAPLQVSFSDLSTGTPTSWSWNFGDGGSSNVQNPVHTYSVTGEYTVVLSVGNSCGSSDETKVNYIKVSEPVCYPPVAAFVGSPASGNAPLTVIFTDQSTNNPTSWSWNFGDGGTSTAKSPSHVFSSAGVFTVTLLVTNSCGSDNEIKTDYITVNTAPQNSVHISEIVVTKETFSKFNRGRTRVKVLDQNGNVASSVTVKGTWSGGASNSSSFTTAADGWGETTTGWSKTVSDYTFCVTSLTKSGYTYDTNANIVTCGSSNGTSWQVLSNVNPEDLKFFAEEFGQNPVEISPNPFNPTTQFNVILTAPSQTRLEIYNILGKRIITLVDEPLDAGMHMIKWNAQDEFSHAVGTGTYFYLLIIDEQKYVGKLLYIK